MHIFISKNVKTNFTFPYQRLSDPSSKIITQPLQAILVELETDKPKLVFRSFICLGIHIEEFKLRAHKVRLYTQLQVVDDILNT